MTPRHTLPLLCTLALLAACRSDPIAFHTLTPVHAPTQASSNAAEVVIEGISVPPQVDRAQIVIRQGSNGLAILETEWWGASLSEELRSALVVQLGNGSAARKVAVKINVQRFDSIPGQYALIDARWRLREAEGGEMLNCHSLLQTPAGPEIEDLVHAQQNNVQGLATQIRQAAGNLRGGCPGER